MAVNRATAGVLAIVAAVGAVAALVVIRSGPYAPIRSGDGWVTVGSVEEVEERSVLYLKEHELFVATTATVPEGFVALSAWTPATEDGDEARRLLYCTLSNLFENQHGDLYDRAGHPLEETSRASLSRIPLRVRDGVVEVAPARAARTTSTAAPTSTDLRAGSGAKSWKGHRDMHWRQTPQRAKAGSRSVRRV